MRTLLVDDEPPARARLRTMLAQHPDIDIVGEAESADEALRIIRAAKPDLVFLDVQMPGGDGFHVVEAMNVSPAPFIVFVTAHSEHAVQAFDSAAGDYLLKPYNDIRLARAVARARAAVDARRGPAGFLERVAVTVGRSTIFVETSAVDWIEARDNYACLHVGAQQHLIRETLTSLEGRLDPKLFVRIHRSSIVRFDRIREVRNLGLGDHAVMLKTGIELPVGQKYRGRLP